MLGNLIKYIFALLYTNISWTCLYDQVLSFQFPMSTTFLFRWFTSLCI
uniref:Uncharacterized protein n=1 Tax=Rhizophora mucronata TaxID=61149 RepID=A0A2P2P569_RHIMU